MAEKIKGCNECVPIIFYDNYTQLICYSNFKTIAESIDNSIRNLTSNGSNFVADFDIVTGSGIEVAKDNGCCCPICKNYFASHYYNLLLVQPKEVV